MFFPFRKKRPRPRRTFHYTESYSAILTRVGIIEITHPDDDPAQPLEILSTSGGMLVQYRRTPRHLCTCVRVPASDITSPQTLAGYLSSPDLNLLPAVVTSHRQRFATWLKAVIAQDAARSSRSGHHAR